ncbi:MAG: SDR family oxidoreductase, partial [Pseudomonadota bacterium]
PRTDFTESEIRRGLFRSLIAAVYSDGGWAAAEQALVNLSSTSIVTNATGVSHYMATKMGIIGFTRGLANDLGKDFITVNAVAPALTATPGTSHLPDAARDAIVNRQAFKRIAVPHDIVGPILFLTSEDAQFMTGQVLAVDGGMMKVA